MKRIISLLIIFVLVSSTVTTGFAGTGSGEFTQTIPVPINGVGTYSDVIATDVFFNKAGDFEYNGENYQFYINVPHDWQGPLDVRLEAAEGTVLKYSLIDNASFEGEAENVKTFSLYPDDFYQGSGAYRGYSHTFDFRVKWYPDARNNQNILHGIIILQFEPAPLYSVTTEVNPSEGGETSGDVTNVPLGTEYSLLATENTGWSFIGWGVEDADPTLYDNPLVGTVVSTTYFTAHFERNQYDLLVDHTGEGSTVPSGSSVRLFEDLVELTAEPAAGWHFVRWDGAPVADENDPTTTVEILGNTHVTAVFERNEYQLYVTHTGDGSTDPAGYSMHEYEAVVDLTATPASGWYFDGWTGPVADSEDPTTTVTIMGNTTVAAVFLPIPPGDVVLSVRVDGQGSTVPPVDDYVVTEGTVVDLSASPAMGWEFIRWDGPVASSGSVDTSITMTTNATVTAVFEPIDYTLTVTHVGQGSTVPSGASTVHYGDVAVLSATPAPGWMFVHWNGPVTSPGQAETTVEIFGNTEVEAVFRELPPSRVVLNVFHIGEGYTVPSGSTVHMQGTEVDLYAYPASGWHFVTWRGPVTSYLTPTSSVVMYESTTVAAVFEPDQVDRVYLNIYSTGPGHTVPTEGTHWYPVGTTVDLEVIPDGLGAYFDYWAGTDGSLVYYDDGYKIDMNGNREIIAVFDAEVDMVALNIDSSGPGYTVPTEGTHWYPVGTTVDLEAIPDGFGAYFVDWVGTHGSEVYYDTGYKILMDDDKEIVALFDTEMEMVELTVSIDGGGEVDSSEGLVTSSRTFTVTPGTTVYMIPDADSGWYFDEWNGADQSDVVNEGSGEYSIYMDEDKTIEAEFNKRRTPPPPIIRHRLTISIEGSGTVDPFIGSQTYQPGTLVDVSADPASGWVFDGWIGPDGSDVSSGQIAMNEDKNIIAKFVRETPPPPIEPPEIEIPLVEPPLGDGDLPDTGLAVPWLTMILGFFVTTFGFFFKNENE